MFTIIISNSKSGLIPFVSALPISVPNCF